MTDRLHDTKGVHTKDHIRIRTRTRRDWFPIGKQATTCLRLPSQSLEMSNLERCHHAKPRRSMSDLIIISNMFAHAGRCDTAQQTEPHYLNDADPSSCRSSNLPQQAARIVVQRTRKGTATGLSRLDLFPAHSHAPNSNMLKHKSPTMLYPKNGIALVKQATSPEGVIGYQPATQTPKLLTRKNKHEATNAPPITRSLPCRLAIQRPTGTAVNVPAYTKLMATGL